jgi:hypothetical protein
LEKNFIEICKEITKKHYLSLNTNLSTSNVVDFAYNINPEKSLFINAAVHITVREKKDKELTSYTEKMLLLQKMGFNVIAYYVVHPSLLSRVKSDMAFLLSKGIQKVRVKVFRGVYMGKYYPFSFSTAEKKYIEDMDGDFPEFEILNKVHNYKGQLCRAGQRFFFMDRTGNLKRCSSLNRRYGNLFEKRIIYDTELRPCPIRKCGCPYEGIRNKLSRKGDICALLKETIIEKSLKFNKVMKDPRLLKKLKEKGIEYFAQQCLLPPIVEYNQK